MASLWAWSNDAVTILQHTVNHDKYKLTLITKEEYDASLSPVLELWDLCISQGSNKRWCFYFSSSLCLFFCIEEKALAGGAELSSEGKGTLLKYSSFKKNNKKPHTLLLHSAFLLESKINHNLCMDTWKSKSSQSSIRAAWQNKAWTIG